MKTLWMLFENKNLTVFLNFAFFSQSLLQASLAYSVSKLIVGFFRSRRWFESLFLSLSLAILNSDLFHLDLFVVVLFISIVFKIYFFVLVENFQIKMQTQFREDESYLFWRSAFDSFHKLSQIITGLIAQNWIPSKELFELLLGNKLT